MNYIYLLIVIYIIPVPILVAATGIADVIEQFKAQADAANPIILNYMQSLTADYIASSAALPMQSVDFTTSTDPARNSLPIASIRYGFVSDFNLFVNNTKFYKVAGYDNNGMFVMEVSFKDTNSKHDIHPSLANKTVLFIAYGPGPEHKTIYTTATNSGRANLADPEKMLSISGFMCFIKTGYCSNTNQQRGPMASCPSANIISTNDSVAPGVLVNTVSYTNLFQYTSGPLGLCSADNATRNALGGVL